MNVLLPAPERAPKEDSAINTLDWKLPPDLVPDSTMMTNMTPFSSPSFVFFSSLPPFFGVVFRTASQKKGGGIEPLRMSSWANRSSVRRRDLSQIPEELRPALSVPRAERPEILLSESYQDAAMISDNGSPFFSLGGSGDRNPIYYPSSGSSPPSSGSRPNYASASKELASLLSALPAGYSGIQPTHPEAKELRVGGKSYVFVILRHIRQPSDNELWISSYNSIRRYYTNRIVIIDDNSQLNTVNGKLYETDIIVSDYAGAGETLPYYYFLMHRWADRMIFLHDTMFLYRPFKSEEVDTDARFHWSFQVKEGQTGVDPEGRIRPFLSSLRNHKELVATLSARDPWRACFGVAMTVGLPVVEAIEDKYKLFSTMVMMIRNRKDREMAERLVGFVFFHEKYVTAETCDNFGDILQYPNAFESETINMNSAKYIIDRTGYATAIMKVWRGR